MTRLEVKTTVRLSGVGWIGALILAGTPLLFGLIAISRMEAIARRARYDLGATNPNEMIGIAIFASVATAIGLVMVLAGREYTHDVRILKPGEETD